MKLIHWAVAAACALNVAGCSMMRGIWGDSDDHQAAPVMPAPSTGNAATAAFPAFQHPPMSPAALMAHVERLASDEFEGRAPSTRGEELTIDYISRAFAALGLQPGANGSWLQPVPIAAAEVTNNPTLTLGTSAYAYGTDFVAWTKRLEPRTSIANAELVFVGYGVVAPENNWNDYAGLDMRGKIAVILINDPDFDTGDNRGFGGRAMTYYGRWTYKFEEAARQGAAGAIIVHEDAAASYGWGTVNSSWTGPQYDLIREDAGASRVAVEGWIQHGVAQLLFQRAGLDFASERRRAQTRGFTPVPLRQRASITLETRVERSVSNNVVGVLPGRTRRQEAVIYGAHWDHLGRCTPVNGDDICNGALDNATGTAGLIELARRFAGEPRTERSLMFIAFTAEEAGLLGSAYYAAHPLFAPRDTAAMINMDGLQTNGTTREILVVGHGQNALGDMLAEAAQRQGREARPEAFPERGSFYRSDHFNLAKIGVPVLYTNAGIDLFNGGVVRGRELANDYIANRYHKPDDEMSASWDMTGGMRDLQLLHEVGRQVADSAVWPAWRQTSEFRAARTASGR